ncbi:MAG TPA: nuclear transport factor 2 family protein [Thermoleophilaceae bacterium]|nr:nuclear transport factor 2 family protein [Thermoleophilaceae bacterium]
MTEGRVRIPLRPPPRLEADPGAAPEELLALPPGSAPRTAFLVERTVGAAEAYNRRDDEALLSFYHPDVEVRIARLGAGGLWGGDFDESYSGHERLLELTRQWADVWEDLILEPEELIDEGGNTFVFIATWVGRGSGSGAEVTTSYQARQSLSGNRIARVEFWPDRETALRELGLAP